MLAKLVKRRMDQQNCQQDISQILPNLYLSNRIAANHPDILKKYGITHILNVCDRPDTVPPFIKGYEQIDIADVPWVSIDKYFKSSAEFIEKALKENAENKVLVHCVMGRSRSATIVIAYLVQKQHMSLDEAFAWTKERRACVNVNYGFERQLHKAFDPEFIDLSPNSGKVVVILFLFLCLTMYILAKII